MISKEEFDLKIKFDNNTAIDAFNLDTTIEINKEIYIVTAINRIENLVYFQKQDLEICLHDGGRLIYSKDPRATVCAKCMIIFISES